MKIELNAAQRLTTTAGIQLAYYPALAKYVRDAAKVDDSTEVQEILEKARVTNPQTLVDLDKWLAANGKNIDKVEDYLNDHGGNVCPYMEVSIYMAFKRLYNAMF